MGKEVLVTGGLGFIGAETTLALVREGYDPVIVDSLVNSKIRNLGALESLSEKKIPFYQGDVRDEALMGKVFSEHSFEAVLHFAALKAVGESVAKPVLYYQNNLGCILSVLGAMERHSVHRILFSSSATVYGDSEDLPFREDSPVREATNPYGETKVMNERMLRDYLVPHPETEVVCLRYFNPVGADPSGLLGEDPNGIPPEQPLPNHQPGGARNPRGHHRLRGRLRDGGRDLCAGLPPRGRPRGRSRRSAFPFQGAGLPRV